MGYVVRNVTEPAITHISNVSLILGQCSWQHLLVCSGLEVWNARWLLSERGRKRRRRNESVIVCHFALLISVNNRVHAWMCGTVLLKCHKHLSACLMESPVNEKCIVWFRCEGAKTQASVLRIIYGGLSVKQSNHWNSFSTFSVTHLSWVRHSSHNWHLSWL